jgi:hypothetical protein
VFGAEQDRQPLNCLAQVEGKVTGPKGLRAETIARLVERFSALTRYVEFIGPLDHDVLAYATVV